MKTFLERLADPAPMLYDGGFGSQLFARSIELVNSTLANESHPEAVIDIHSDYIAAGVDIIGTNTFVASPLHLEMAGKQASEAGAIASLAVKNAKAAVEKSGKDIYIAGSIGPSPGAIEADAGSTDFGIDNNLVRQAHERIVDTLAEGGVDFFVLETMFSATEAAIAVDVARRAGLPIAVNLTYKYTKDRHSGQIIYKTDWGHSAASLLEILASGEFSGGDNLIDSVDILGLNCGAETRRSEHTGMPYAVVGSQQMQEALNAASIPNKHLMAYPNAGMPLLDKNHLTYYSQMPEEMASHLPALLNAGVHLVGGCCGTTPDHIRAFRQALDAG
jgi:methionine synthase I (cobalamin-dependent)